MNAELLKNIIILTQGKANLTSIRKQGYTYSQIAQAIVEAENKGFLEMVDNRLLVTDVGKEYVEKANKRTSQGGSANWIIPQGQYYKKPVHRHAVLFKKNRHNWYSRVLRSIPC